MTVVYIILVVLVIFFLWLASAYNGLVSLKNRTDEAWADIDVQLKRRYDLVPKLVESVKGYVKHETAMITKVTDARKALLSAKDIGSKIKAGDKLQGALKTVFALAENYPNLKANENFLQLQEELSSIEDKVAYSRQFYNDNILAYNNSIQMFPGSLFAGIFGKSKKEFLQITNAEKAVPKVQF